MYIETDREQYEKRDSQLRIFASQHIVEIEIEFDQNVHNHSCADILKEIYIYRRQVGKETEQDWQI